MSLARQGLGDLRALAAGDPPGAPPAPSRDQPIDGNAMRRLKGRLGVEQGLPPRATAQFDRYDALRERVASRVAFTALDASGKPATIADSYLRGDIAVLEDVATLRRHRRQGLASAAVMAATSNAIGLGARAVALFADPEIAQRFYGPLGFEAIGGAWDCRLAPPGKAAKRRS